MPKLDYAHTHTSIRESCWFYTHTGARLFFSIKGVCGVLEGAELAQCARTTVQTWFGLCLWAVAPQFSVRVKADRVFFHV